ncbi:MAG: hypothetical protein KAJ66_05560, partial [Candidatus Omnitrophica bacterium]|nr:hypothetical protein [Candidatus Omnitrophota bacterium]
QTDPVGYEDSMNLYQYCLNNPLNFTDPLGLFCWGELAWWEKFGKGYYYGTGTGIKASEYWADRYAETGNPLYAIPGTLSESWRPKTFRGTGFTLISAATLGQAPTSAKVKVHPPHHTFKIFGKKRALKHIQMDLWKKGIKGSGRSIRVPLPGK